MKGILALGKQLIEVISTNTWERIFFLLILFAGSGLLFLFMMVLYYQGIPIFIFGLAIPFGIIILLSWVRLQLRGNFFADVAHEMKERTRYIRLLLGMSMNLDHQLIQSRTKHFIFFRQSNHLFRNRRVETVLVELGIKTFLRDRNQLFSYIRIMGVSIFAILQVPLTLKWFLWPLVGFYLAYWCKNFWKDIESSSFLRIFHISEGELLKARDKVIQWLTLPGFFFISILVGFVTYQWIGVLLMLPISYSLSYLLGRIIGVFD